MAEKSKYIKQKKNFYDHLLKFFDDENEVETDLLLEELMENDNIEELKSTLRLILNISNNHYRTPLFDQKINQILLLIFNNNKQVISNYDIFLIFKNNKRILLLLIKNKIISIDQYVLQFILNDETYYQFFYSEIKSYLSEKQQKQIEEELLKIDIDIFSTYENKREIGENDTYIGSLIRQDIVEEFITFVNKNNISLSNTTIPKSFFETNSFLLDKTPTLIEYSSFFGSIKIFKYLQMNNIQLTPSLWLYGIHSNNAEIIGLLEENKVAPENNNYEICLMESIKCHHNDIARYIKDNYITYKTNSNENLSDEVKSVVVSSFNYLFFPNNNINCFSFYNLCNYDHIDIVNLLLQKGQINFEKNLIQKTKFLIGF